MFHVRPTGDLGKCTAASGKCPFRNEGAQHFSTFKDAAAHAEKIFADEAGGVFSKGISSQGNEDVQVDYYGNGLVLIVDLTMNNARHVVDLENLPKVAVVNEGIRKVLASSLEKGLGMETYFLGEDLRGRLREAKGSSPYFQLLFRRFLLGETELYAVALAAADNDKGTSSPDWENVATSAKYFTSRREGEYEFEKLRNECTKISIAFGKSN
jgi:hypothetical protein